MYDMYPWSKRSAASQGRAQTPPATPRDSAGPDGGSPDPSATPRRRADLPSRTPDAAQAVQVALDRRDNGGEAAAAEVQTLAGPARQ